MVVKAMRLSDDFWPSAESRWLMGVTSDGNPHPLNNLPALRLLVEKRLDLLCKYAPLIFTLEAKETHMSNLNLLYELVEDPIANLPAINATVINRPLAMILSEVRNAERR